MFTKEQTRAYLARRAAVRTPIPSADEIRRQLGPAPVPPSPSAR